MLTDKAEIKRYLSLLKAGRLASHPFETSFPAHRIIDGKVELGARPLKLHNGLVKDGQLVFGFTGSSGQVSLRSQYLKSFIGMPESIYNVSANDNFSAAFMTIRENKLITSLEGFAKKVHGDLNFSKLYNVSFTHVNKHIEQVWAPVSGTRSIITISDSYSGPLLSFLRVNGNFFLSNTSINAPTELKTAFNIVNDYLVGDRNIGKCQLDLYKNGLKQFASL